jgi:transmembrane sensor
MTIRTPDTDDLSLEREAHRWIGQLVSGEATVADARELQAWCGQSAAHAAAFAEAAERWRDLEPVGRDVLRTQGLIPERDFRPTRRALIGGLGALAASGAGYAIIAPPLAMWPSFAELAADYRTTTGEQREITLAGNIGVRMNTQTSIAVASAPESDRLTLVAGEASFTTSPYALKPLVLVAGNGKIVADEARFDARMSGSATRVTCLAGEVRVECGMQAVELGSNRQISYDENGFAQALDIDPADVVAWQNGFVVFRSTPLSAVIEEINRYRPGRVILMNASLASIPVNGRFRVQRIGEVLAWIEQGFGVSSRVLPGGVVLLS